MRTEGVSFKATRRFIIHQTKNIPQTKNIQMKPSAKSSHQVEMATTKYLHGNREDPSLDNCRKS